MSFFWDNFLVRINASLNRHEFALRAEFSVSMLNPYISMLIPLNCEGKAISPFFMQATIYTLELDSRVSDWLHKSLHKFPQQN